MGMNIVHGVYNLTYKYCLGVHLKKLCNCGSYVSNDCRFWCLFNAYLSLVRKAEFRSHMTETLLSWGFPLDRFLLVAVRWYSMGFHKKWSNGWMFHGVFHISIHQSMRFGCIFVSLWRYVWPFHFRIGSRCSLGSWSGGLHLRNTSN